MQTYVKEEGAPLFWRGDAHPPRHPGEERLDRFDGPERSPQGEGSALGDLAFLVLLVLAARGTELLDDELLGHRALVLGGVVVRAATDGARHLDDVTHGLSSGGLRAHPLGPEGPGVRSPRRRERIEGSSGQAHRPTR